MIFDGMRWVRCRSVVVLPYEMWHGEHKNYAMFGKISKKSAKGAVKTGSVYRHSYPRRFWEGDTCPEPNRSVVVSTTSHSMCRHGSSTPCQCR